MTARQRLIAGLLGALSWMALPAMAWNASGHRLITGIAWETMTPAARAEAGRLLREHPDAERWQRRAPEDDSDRHLFIAAATWPDEIRKDKRFYSPEDEEPTPTLEGFPHMRRHSEWHYEARPFEGSRRDAPALPRRTGQIGEALGQVTDTLGNRQASSVERRYALPWLIHLAGDAHQPLHLSLRLDSAGRWDKLGSAVQVIAPNARKPKTTLHAFWDDLGGPPGLHREALEAGVRQLMADYPQNGVNTRAPFDHWLDESWRLARQSAYPPDPDDSPTLDDAFLAHCRAIATRRIAEAGYRLGTLLNRLLGH